MMMEEQGVLVLFVFFLCIPSLLDVLKSFLLTMYFHFVLAWQSSHEKKKQ